MEKQLAKLYLSNSLIFGFTCYRILLTKTCFASCLVHNEDELKGKVINLLKWALNFYLVENLFMVSFLLIVQLN